MKNKCAVTAIAIASGFMLAPAMAQSPKVGDPPEASNMRLVGHNDLQARSAYQPIIHRQGLHILELTGDARRIVGLP